VKLGEIVKQVSVDSRKLTEYALNPEAPWGRHKAVVFEQELGFTRENCVDLLAQIERWALDPKLFFTARTSSGDAIR
jgi:hypothetical protein